MFGPPARSGTEDLKQHNIKINSEVTLHLNRIHYFNLHFNLTPDRYAKPAHIMTDEFFLLSCCFTFTEATRSLLGTGEMGGGRGDRVLASALRSVKTEKTVSHRQNNNAKEVGTLLMQSNWCTLLTAVSTAVQKRVAESEGSTVEEQLGVTGKLHCHHHNDSYIKMGH